jgi:hypothetical protein
VRVVTVNVPDLPLDVHDSCCILSPLPHKANAYAEVHVPPILGPLANLKVSYRTGTIGRLSDAVLLNIFRYYLHKSPRLWPRLVHICRKWRHIVFASQQTLHLRLFCAPGTPVLKTLDCWPPFSIVMAYGGSLAVDPPAPEDEINLIAALKRSDRVSSISLTVTTSLLVKLYAIERSFLALDDLILLSLDSVPLTLPSTFLWGRRLRRLHLTRIGIPGLLQLLRSSSKLVDLQLHEALNPWYFSIEELTDALSGLAQLRSLHFTSTNDHVPPPSPTDRRVVLPALTRLKFRGSNKTLDRLILRMDAPRLEDIQVTVPRNYADDHDLSRLGEFVDRIEMHKSHHQARILSSEHAISISLTQPGAPTCFKARLLCKPHDQLQAIHEAFCDFSALLLSVEDLCISATQTLTVEGGYYNNYRWQRFFKSFPSVKWLHLDVNDSTDILCALQLEGTSFTPKTVLPAPYKLYLPQPGPRHAPLSDTVVSLMTSRWRSGNPIGVEYERLCRISDLHGRDASLCAVSLPTY